MKERLTGAIILVVLIVLLVPELLSGPSRSAPVPQAAASSSSEEPPLRSYTINLADDSHPAASSAETSSPLPQASGPAQPSPIVESPTQPPAPSASDPGNSQTPEQTHESAQPPPSPVTTPQATSAEQPQPTAPRHSASEQHPSPAERAVGGQHYAALGKEPAAERASPATKSSGSGEWMVQLGVFANHANAERLAQELKGKGFHTVVSETGGGRRTLWRVRAGPVAERTAAEQLNARLRNAGHPGSVVPK